MKIHFVMCLTAVLGVLMMTAEAQSATQPSSKSATQPPSKSATQSPSSTTARSPSSSGMTIRQMKDELEKSPNPLLYTRDVLKRRFKIDTVTVTETAHFGGLADSLAYHGKERKVYGPYGPKDGRFLVMLLSKAPNTFYHISQIFIDTSIFSYRIADSLGNVILKKLKNGTATFEDLARTYTIGRGATTGGDVGWVAHGAMFPVVEHEVAVHKKGDVFKLWTRAGLNIMRKDDDPRQDTGYALMMQVFL